MRNAASNGILSSSDDLDSITIPGHYGWNKDVPVNAPFNAYCVMIVEMDGAQSIQLVYGSTSGQMAMRRANSGTYGGWEEVALLSALSEIGVGQTWQYVSGSRSDGVTYTNSTGKPIVVFVNAGASPSGRIKVDGHVFDWSVLGATDEAGTAIVPAGSTYEYIDNFVTVLELR